MAATSRRTAWLTDHDAVLREVFRLGETDRHFGHGLGGKTQVLRAPHHDSECPEQDDGHDGERDEGHDARARRDLIEGADLEQASAKHACWPTARPPATQTSEIAAMIQ